MKLLRTVLLILLVVVVVLVAGGFVIFNKITRGPLPNINGELTVPGLQDAVTIKRDDWGVPYIYASNTHDLFFAQGYAQAQDRWWQMEWFRAVGDGRLEELTGQNDDLVGNDVFIRTIGWRRAAERDVASAYDETTLAYLQAFADGVNACINGKNGGDLAFEYSILGVTGVNIPVRPWTVTDSVVWQKVMSWDLSNQLYDLDRADLVEQVGADQYAEYEPAYPFEDKPTIVEAAALPITDASLHASGSASRDTTTALASAPASTAIGDQNLQLAGNFTPQGFAFGSGDGIGSNNWVVSGKLTESGKPLLANDPHLGIQMPSIWYEVGLYCRPVSDACPFEVRGFTFAPFPGVVIGHNSRVAWGFTNVGPDVMDLYQIEVNPENPLQYKWDGEWRDMTVADETIKYGDSEDTLTIQVRETHLGPIINDNRIGDDGKPSGFNNENPMALRWTALDESHTLTALFNLDTAQNWDDFRKAASLFDAPSQNLVYADVDGNIGYQTPGLMPVRPAGMTGLLPVDGTTSANEWLGYIPFDMLPRVLNPESGYIHSANEALVPPEYYTQLADQLADQFGADANYVISTDWDYGYRGQRIVQRLTSEAPFTIDKFKAIQADTTLISAEEILPYLKDLQFDDAAVKDARDWLLMWDARLDMDSPQPVLYANFWDRLVANLFNDDLGDLGPAGRGSQQMWAVRELLDQPDDAWWDDTGTADVTETRDDILARAFSEGYAAAVKAGGSDRSKWKWGDIHTTTFVSNPLGGSGIDLIEKIVNRGPVATSGGTATVSAASWSGGTFEVGSGSSFRMIVDLSDLANSINMHTTGQSGHPYSPYYDSMIDSWRKVQYKPMLWTDDQVSGAAKNTLTLKP